ncbi:MAG: prolyl oligopeptidase family serine peptidase [Marinicaulis sp.]|nr:prolyl oligopeptidase family serine peptidase [Marinicaulis sp.]
MKRWAIIGSIIAAALVVFWRIEPLYLSLYSAATPAASFDDRVALIEPAMELRLPDGAGPFPVVIQFHGCAGIRPPFQAQWADIANDAGFAALIVDSVGPRGMSRPEAVEAVCGGKRLVGQERAGDIMAAVEIAVRNPELDPTQIILAGWSHGAWSVMDYLTMDQRGKGPAGLTNWPATSHKISGAILVYPYCGLGTLSRFRQWREAPPTLALIAGEDSMVDAEECITYFETEKRDGRPIDITIYPETEHAFDDPFIEPDWQHWHSPEAFVDAKTRYANFLKSRKS